MLAIHHLALFLGFGSISLSAHQIHVSLPINRLLDAGIDPAILPWPHDLLFSNIMRLIFRRFGTGPLVDFSIFLPKGYHSSTVAQSSAVFAHHSYALSCYPYLATDYPTVLCLFTHHLLEQSTSLT